MTKDFLYWFFLMCWLLFSGWFWWGAAGESGPRRYGPLGVNLFLLILLVLIGLALFGTPVK